MKGSQRYFRCHVPHHERKQAVVDFLSGLKKPKSNTMAEKKEKFSYQGQCKRRKKIAKG